MTPPSRLAGAARRRFSATSETAVYCAIMNPESTPLSAARNAGSPLTSGLTSRSMRRSDMAASSATRDAERIGAQGRGPRRPRAPRRTRAATAPLPSNAGLSVTDASSASAAALACSNCSRTAACTCGIARRLNGSCVRRPGAGRQNRAACQSGAQPFAHPPERRRDPQAQALGLERRHLAAQILEGHGADQIRPVQQPFDAQQRERGHTRRAGRAVHQAQSLLGLEHQRLQARGPQRLERPAAARLEAAHGRRRAAPARYAPCATDIPPSPRRALRVCIHALRSAISCSTTSTRTPEYPCAKLLTAAAMIARTAAALERRSDADGGAHDDVARQLALLGGG